MSFKGFFKDAFTSRKNSPLKFKPEDMYDILGYHFRQPEFLELALTHRSIVRSQSEFLPSNERLEFLGDSVLGLVIADQLYHDYPCLSEGDLTKMKALLVNETTLSMIGRNASLNKHILLSAEEDRAGGRERDSIVSDSVEAVIGAIFLDGGLGPARDVILRLLYVHREMIMNDKSQQNYKGDLLEIVQGKSQGMPHYEVVEESGPDHDKLFKVQVSVNGTVLGSGEGSSKKEAEQRAARIGLHSLKKKK